jgi:hypothetical protein
METGAKEMTMNLLEALAGSQSSGAVSQIGQSLGIGDSQMQGVLQQVVPALARGMQNNTRQSGGLEALIGAVSKGNHQRYLENPDDLVGTGGIADGNKILGHILGSKDASRNVAARAAEQTGVGADVIKKALPMVAALAMGALSRQAGQEGLTSGRPDTQSALGTLNTFLDADRDGSAIDDVINLAKKFF